MRRTFLRTIVLKIYYPAVLWEGLSSVQLYYKSTTLLYYGKDFPPDISLTNPLSRCVMERTFLRTVVLQIHYASVLWIGISSIH
jgi:hypothetical protein